MKYKRGRVVAGRGLVNAGVALAVLFLAGCGARVDDGAGVDADGAADRAETGAVSEVGLATDGEVAREGGLVLPAVWSTRALDGPIADIALSDGADPLLAVAFEGRGFQLFNLEGERLGEPIGFGVEDLAGGTFVDLSGAGVTVFPGLARDGALKAYLYNERLQAPVELDLPVAEGETVLGVCSAVRDATTQDEATERAGGAGDGGVLRLGYWTEAAPGVLVSGVLGVRGEAFTWEETARAEGSSPLAACRLGRDGTALPLVGDPLAAAVLDRREGRADVTLNAGGTILVSTPFEGPEAVTIREGLSVRVPVPPVAMDAIGSPRSGGYPFGLIVIAGETAPDTHQAVFLDTTPLVERMAGPDDPGGRADASADAATAGE